MARISTHVLDVSRGKPAPGIAVELRRDDISIATATTNADGRTDAPLLSADALPVGQYELIFQAGPYLTATGAAPLFFDEIKLQFHVNDAQANYHVPLLLAAHGYSTYRGS